MKTVIIFIFCITTICLSCQGICDANVVICNSHGEMLTKLYDRPSIDGTIIGLYYDTVEVIVLKVKGDWVQVKIGEQKGYVASHNIGVSTPQKGVQWAGAKVASRQFEELLPAYETPSKSSDIVKYLPNGYYVWVLGYLFNDWVYIRFQDNITTKFAYVNIDANELADVTKEPPEHPLYKGAFLCLEEGYQYYFEKTMPSQLECAFFKDILEVNQVLFGAISSWDSKKAAVVLKNDSQISLCLMSIEENSWEIISTNDTIFHPTDNFSNTLTFSGPYELRFHIPWLGCNAICVLESDIWGQWNLKLIGLYGDLDDPTYSRDILIEPVENGLYVHGSVQARNQMSHNIDVKLEDNELPSLENPLFNRLNMDRIQKLIILSIPDAFQ